MPEMRIFKVLQTTIRFSRTTIFLLLDEQQQRLLALQGWEQVPSVPLQATAAQGVVPADLANCALRGTLAESHN